MQALKANISERVNPSGSISFAVDAGLINGKRHRKFFPTVKAARIYARKIAKAKHNQGSLAFSLNSRQQIEAAEAFKRLEPAKTTLTEAIDFFIKHAQPKGGTKIVNDVVKELLLEKQKNGAKPRYLKELRCKFGKFSAAFGNANINEVSKVAMEQWLEKNSFSNLTKTNYLRDLGILFKHAVEQNYSAENVVTKIKKPILKETPVEIFTVSEALRLLFAAHVFPEYKLVPYIAIGLFAGLRSCELESLDWKEISLHQMTIEVKAEKSKTSRRRIVTISPNLAEWLKPHEKMEGSIVCKCWREKLQELAKIAEFEKWPKNGLRHSFGSYHLARFKNANETAHEMGHESTKMLFRHYREVVTPQAAEEYWNLLPPKNFVMIPPSALLAKKKIRGGEDKFEQARKAFADLGTVLGIPALKAA